MKKYHSELFASGSNSGNRITGKVDLYIINDLDQLAAPVTCLEAQGDTTPWSAAHTPCSVTARRARQHVEASFPAARTPLRHSACTTLPTAHCEHRGSQGPTGTQHGSHESVDGAPFLPLPPDFILRRFAPAKRHVKSSRTFHSTPSGVWQKLVACNRVSFPLERARVKPSFWRTIFIRGFPSNVDANKAQKTSISIRGFQAIRGCAQTSLEELAPLDNGGSAFEPTKTDQFHKFGQFFQHLPSQTPHSKWSMASHCSNSACCKIGCKTAKKNLGLGENHCRKIAKRYFSELFFSNEQHPGQAVFPRMTGGSATPRMSYLEQLPTEVAPPAASNCPSSAWHTQRTHNQDHPAAVTRCWPAMATPVTWTWPFGDGIRIGEAAVPGPSSGESPDLETIRPSMRIRCDTHWIADEPSDEDHISETWSVEDQYGGHLDHSSPPACEWFDIDQTEADAPAPPPTPAAPAPPIFIPFVSFAGPRAGYYFSKGPLGLGYYYDLAAAIRTCGVAATPVVAQPGVPPGARPVDPITIRIDDWLNSVVQPAQPPTGCGKRIGPSAGAAGAVARPSGLHGARDGPLSCRKYVPGRASRSPQPLLDAEALLKAEVVAGSFPHPTCGGVLLESDVHRQCGLWALDSANANAWSGLVEYLKTTAADMLVGQEAKTWAGDSTLAGESSLRTAKWRGKIGPCTHGPAGGASAGTLVAVRQHIGMADSCVEPIHPVAHRFLMKKVAAVCKGGFHLGSVYMHDRIGPASELNLKLLDDVAFVLRAISGPWILGGDWNCSPSALAATGFLQLVGGVIHAPTDSTCGGNTYDYFIVSRALSPAVHSVRAVSNSPFNPHCAVRLYLRAAPRAMMVRKLISPKGFPARLPFGPPNRPDILHAASADAIAVGPTTAHMEVDTEYPKLLSIIEHQLSAVAGHSEAEAAQHAGRSAGPKLSWVSAIDAPTGVAGLSAVTRAWTLTAKWLRTLSGLPAGNNSGAARLRRAICRHDHQLPSSLDGQLFQQWQCSVTSTALQSQHWATMLLEVATSMAQRHTDADVHRSRASWITWLNDGPAAGLRKQHAMSRVAVGWIPSTQGRCGDGDDLSLEEAHSLHQDDQLTERDVRVETCPTELTWDAHQPTTEDAAGGLPRSAQQSADREAAQWSRVWGADATLPDCEWPADMGPLPPMLELHSFKEALATFPAALGLGWDGIHPKALLRLSDAVLHAILRLLFLCEAKGVWPTFSAAVLVALLPKTSGGRRSIGLFAWLPKVWAKARRSAATAWEAANSRPWLYAGPSKGAAVAAWKQGARGELASYVPSAQYGMALVDLVKAFDQVPHHLVVREAIRLGYNLWILRLSIAAYRASRIVRMDGACAAPVVPRRSLTAGGGFATTEMRLVMINIIDQALAVAPAATPTLYVDDLTVEASGSSQFVLRQLLAFTLAFCDAITANHMEVSRPKSLCTASSGDLGLKLQHGLRRYGIQFRWRVTSLGSSLGAGKRRNMTVTKKRLADFKKRLPRFRKLAAVGVATKRLLRTGGTAALTYGQGIFGVAPSVLLAQRRAVAAASAPSSGPCGQDLDMALAMADGSAKGRADPAYEAHLQPIGQWAEAIWDEWLPSAAMSRLVTTAARLLRRVTSPWQNVRGPAAAMLASADRLSWQVLDHSTLVTDAGRTLQLELDPPIVIKREVMASVRRWRDRRVFAKHPHLGNSADSHGLYMQTHWALLNGRDDPQHRWGPQSKGALRSALAGRQWPQLRCWNSQFGAHSKCLFCVRATGPQEEMQCEECPPEPRSGAADAASHEAPEDASSSEPQADVQLGGHLPEPRDDAMPPMSSSFQASPESAASREPQHQAAIDAAPVGSLRHRICECPSLRALLLQHGPDLLKEAAANGTELPDELCEALATGLFPIPKLILEEHLRPPTAGTFRWLYRANEDQFVRGRFYTDASRIANGHPDTLRLGWSFVALNDQDEVIAVASGVPPSYVDDVPGAEAWALFQATGVADYESTFRVDCKSCVDAVHAGMAWACQPHRPLARVHRLLLGNTPRFAADAVVWMPSHTSEADVGRKVIGNGQLLTRTDRDANARADLEAKAAAALFSVNSAVVQQLDRYRIAAIQAGRWIGLATWAATHYAAGGSDCPRDSEASRARAGAHRRQAQAAARGRGPRPMRPPRVVPGLAERIEGLAAAAEAAASAARGLGGEQLQEGTVVAHRRMLSGTILWCNACGAYTESRGRGLARSCPGPPAPRLYGGRAQQLRRLRDNRHPKTDAAIPQAVPETRWAAAPELQPPTTLTTTSALDPPSPSRSTWCARRSQQLLERVRAREAGSDPASLATGGGTEGISSERAAKVARLVAAATAAAAAAPTVGEPSGAATAPSAVDLSSNSLMAPAPPLAAAVGCAPADSAPRVVARDVPRVPLGVRSASAGDAGCGTALDHPCRAASDPSAIGGSPAASSTSAAAAALAAGMARANDGTALSGHPGEPAGGGATGGRLRGVPEDPGHVLGDADAGDPPDWPAIDTAAGMQLRASLKRQSLMEDPATSLAGARSASAVAGCSHPALSRSRRPPLCSDLEAAASKRRRRHRPGDAAAAPGGPQRWRPMVLKRQRHGADGADPAPKRQRTTTPS